MEEENFPLEFKEYKNYNENLLLLRKKLIEKTLDLKKVNFYHKKDIKKGLNIYIFYQMGEIIYLEKKKLIEILTSINNIKIKEKEENIELDNKYLAQNPRLITSFLNLFPTIKGKFFDYNDIYDRENMERIDKYQVPLYKVFRENKYGLLNILKNHKLNYCPCDINHFLLHDRIPFINYEELKESLKKYYGFKKEDYHKIFKKDKEDTCLYLMGRNEVIVVEDPEGYNVFTKNPPMDKDEESSARQKYIEKLDNTVENNKEISFDIMSNKDILNLEIIDNKAYSIPPISKDIDKKNNYHRGYYDNGIYECEKIKEEKEKLKTIDPKLIKIEIMLDYDNFYNVVISFKDKIIELNYFYIPNDKEFIVKVNLEKLWERGYFLTPFGKAVYTNDNVILESELSKPEWLKSFDKPEFDKLIKYISTIS